MSWKFVILAALMALPASAAWSRPPPPPTGICKTLGDGVTRDLKRIAKLQAQAEHDPGVATDTDRQQSDLAEAVNGQLGQMKDAGCAPYPYPVSPARFAAAADRCALITQTARQDAAFAAAQRVMDRALAGGGPSYASAATPNLPACDVDRWPDGGGRR